MMTKTYRVTSLFVLMALLLAAGCTKERPTLEEPADPSAVTPSYGTTYMSLNLRTDGGSGPSEDSNSESAPNHNRDWAGDDDFTTFAVYVVSDNRKEVHYIGGPITGNADVVQFKDGTLTLRPWKTSVGNKTIYAFLNPPDQYVTWLGETLSNKDDFLERIAEPIPFQGKSGVTYSTQPEMYAFRPDPNIAKKVLAQPKKEVDPVPSFKTLPADLFTNEDTPLSIFFRGVKPSEKVPPFLEYRDHMMCSGISKENKVEPDVTETEVKDRRANLFTMSVRRVLAQAVVTADNSILNTGIQGDPEKSQMRLRGLYYQVLNFEPSFFPIAQKTDDTTDDEWYNNKNTKTPSSGNLAPNDFINFSTYKTNVSDYPDFSASTLISDNYFRSMLFPKKEEIMVGNELKMPELFRRLELVGNSFEGYTVPDFTYNKSYPTTLWGSCYVTETTHKWGKGTDSEYRKGNTPFFAVIAAFDIASLPWAAITYGVFEQEKADMDARYQRESAALDAAIRKKEQELAPLEEALKPLQDEVARLEKEWYTLVKPGLEKISKLEYADNALEYREEYKAGGLTRSQYLRRVNKKIDYINRRLGDANDPNLADAKKKWKEIDEKDLLIDASPNKEKVFKLQKEINDLNKQKEGIYDKIYGEIYSLKFGKGDEFTRRLYLRGITRIYYSLDEQKFYLDYHTIPVAHRSAGHSLLKSDTWLKNLRAKRLPTVANGVPADAAIPEPTQPLLDKFSAVLNGTPDNTLTPEEKRAMDFYIYGRVSPKLATFFGAKSEYDVVDLRLGYLEEYTATTPDKVVNYDVLIRKRANGDVKDGRLLMVYYAWVNPSTNNRATWYSSPVLRNNIYHMHITGFSRMGLSGIPFVKKPENKPNTYLHNLDPDEKVPGNDEHLPMADTQMTVQVTNVGWGIHSFKKKF